MGSDKWFDISYLYIYWKLFIFLCEIVLIYFYVVIYEIIKCSVFYEF